MGDIMDESGVVMGSVREPHPIECEGATQTQAPERKFVLGQRVTKIKGSNWTGTVVGFYSTVLTPIGYNVESETEKGSVQIYPESALAAALQPAPSESDEAVALEIERLHKRSEGITLGEITAILARHRQPAPAAAEIAMLNSTISDLTAKLQVYSEEVPRMQNAVSSHAAEAVTERNGLDAEALREALEAMQNYTGHPENMKLIAREALATHAAPVEGV